MSKPRKPYLQKEISRHGKIVWYFRRSRREKRVRLRGEYDSEEFIAAYDAALAGKPFEPSERGKAGKETLKWLIEQYMASSGEWKAFKPATRKQREAIFRRIIAKRGDEPYAEIIRKDIIASRDAAQATPAQANVIIKVLRHLFDWAVAAQHVKTNPTTDVSF